MQCLVCIEFISFPFFSLSPLDDLTIECLLLSLPKRTVACLKEGGQFGDGGILKTKKKEKKKN